MYPFNRLAQSGQSQHVRLVEPRSHTFYVITVSLAKGWVAALGSQTVLVRNNLLAMVSKLVRYSVEGWLHKPHDNEALQRNWSLF